MNTRICLGMAAGGLLVGAFAHAQRIVAYEPAQVRLTGKVHKLTLPGEPNFESITRGDRPEVCCFLTLDRPVTVQGEGRAEVNVTEKRVTDFQLTSSHDPAIFRQIQRLAKHQGRVLAAGTLFHSHTGHHHTAVLMDVIAIRAAAPPSRKYVPRTRGR